ncbi:MAG: inner-rane translocator [Marmoricola sp.]|nr:inner-rane translocator [Marmoricola sp.]
MTELSETETTHREEWVTPMTDSANPVGKPDGQPRTLRIGKILAVRNIGAIYVWLVIVLLFSVISGSTFFTSDTAKAVLNQYAITGIVGLSVIVPLAAGVYDLSIGSIMGLSGVLAAYLLQHTSMSPVVVGAVVLLLSVVIGLANAFVVAGLKVNSFIATLGTGAILTAITTALSGGLVITGRIGGTFSQLATTSFGGIQIAVGYMLLIMLMLGYWLERTQSGRQIYATGFDGETARLTGAPVTRIVTLSFVTSAAISGFAGMVLAAQVASGSPDVGQSYLIPAFSAAFLGATQLRGGRFNPWGTVIGVLLLGTGNVGLLVAGGPTWTPNLFVGCVLIAAVALSATHEGGRSRIRRLLTTKVGKS